MLCLRLDFFSVWVGWVSFVINVLTVWPFLKKRRRKINYSSKLDIFSLNGFLEQSEILMLSGGNLRGN